MMYLRPIIFIFHWKTRGDPDMICLITKKRKSRGRDLKAQGQVENVTYRPKVQWWAWN